VCGWLAYRIAALLRYQDPRGSLATLEGATLLATEASDRVLAACVLFLRGNLHCYVGEFQPGLTAMAAGAAAYDALTGEERTQLRTLGSVGGFVPDARQQHATLTMRLAGTGRFVEACRTGEALLAPQARPPAGGDAGDLAEANASRGLAVAHAALGRPDAARREFARARSLFEQLGDHFHVGVTATQELQWVALPYRADRPAEWEHLSAETERAWAPAGDAPAELPRGFARLPVLLLTGAWAEAHALALAVHAGGGSYKATATRALGVLARERGDVALAWRLIRDELPAGPDTPVGTANFSIALLLQRLAASLALDADDQGEARAWLTAHDNWLTWSGAVLGQAEGQLGWAACHRAAGEPILARQHAIRALDHARQPRQPLALLAGHRLMGELETLARRHTEAQTHLEQALALADACGAPYERALTLVALAELRLVTGGRAAARSLVDEARGTCATLEALPALARADALVARLVPARSSRETSPAGLSEREAEILRLVAAGESNREIAAALALSVRTVEKHVAHIYNKLGARGRADAAASAVRHGLLPEVTSQH
jgi:DNA-binding CsgD family transcriptional regulator